MKKNMKKLLALVLVLAMALTVFAGCGGGDSGSGSGGTADDSTLRIRLRTALQSADWQQCAVFESSQIIWVQVFEGLYGMDEAHGGYYNLLAKNIDVSEDGLTYTVDLVDATFQNGDPLTAEDVAYSYGVAMENPRFDYVTSMINNVKAVDDKTVVITLDYPYSAISHTFWTIKVYSKREYEEAKANGVEFGTVPHTAGTGPYIITEYDVSAGLKLKAYENYWKGAPDIKNVEYRLITEDSAAVIAYENGELDYLTNVPLSDWDNIKKAAGDNCELIKNNDVLFVGINWASPTNNNILGNQKVREAIFYAVNKANIIKAATSDYGTPAYEYMPSEYVATSPKVSDGKFKTFDYDKDACHQALLDAGYTEDEIKAGIDVGTILTYGTETSEKGKAAVVLQACLAENGMKAQVELGESAPITARMYDQDYDIAIYYDSGNYDYNNIRQQLHSESKGMYIIRYKADNSPFNWQRMEELITMGVSTADEKERYDIYTELWNMTMETATILPLYHSALGVAWSDRIDIGDVNPSFYHITDFSWTE
ncbi:ABC transporter substrate-binding protein [Bacilliculturomica massiliensis]|uniref:ABC transporter substrate-binding protein n=1 Tax=Bacilliculturomica massiliensis TaxID=1917867 RepID=UPI001030853B|nr:ABC transporter substrate-binding protein [Bacilliculturomica massiliensis]